MKKKIETSTLYQLYFVCPNGTEYLVHEDTDFYRFLKKKSKAYNPHLTGVKDLFIVRRIDLPQAKGEI